ncbi:MAG: hypothetical protein KDH96_08035, partial [Candidatus Riesia sp.]|nr:hypothetical protein [Candidatus Riesia sp.]
MNTTVYTQDKTKVLEGINKSANAVCSTMGGEGKTVIISQGEHNRFTKDGVAVAKSMSFLDPEENIGAKIVISAAEKTVAMAGDGTTLTTKLLQGFVNAIHKNPERYLKNLNETFYLLTSGRDFAIDELRKNSAKIEDSSQIYKLAATAANSEEIGKLFKEIFDTTGDFDTKITLEKSEFSDKTYFDITKGLTFDLGYAHPSFMTNKDTEQAIYENAYVHVTKDPIMSLTPEIEALMNTSMKEDIPLVIIAPKYSDAFMRIATMNKVNQGARFLLLRLPGFGNSMEKNVEDINAFLDADGCVEKVVADPVSFTLFNSDTPFVKPRVEQLTKLIEHSIDKFEAMDMEKRIHNLKGTAVIIYAGGVTPEACDEEFDRIEDAIGSVKTALTGEGYSLGAGIAMFNIYQKHSKELDPIFEVLTLPAKQILHNANMDISLA